MIVSHYENNYDGAVKRLNLIDEQLAGLDFVKAPGFLVNGLKRKQLIATNSMILHEVFFAGLGDESEPDAGLKEALVSDFGSYDCGSAWGFDADRHHKALISLGMMGSSHRADSQTSGGKRYPR